ncbi:MAG: sulfite exporter TauE/SafE family protein, partial [Betaproteobacteria bacterium]|nr:sulfite exporter TauE/SafE family protein [Betaproteobacteria bacterium]
LYMLVVSVLRLPQLRCSAWWAWPAGVLGGFFDTIFGGGGGTLVVIYVNARGIARDAFRATLAALWFFEMLARIAGYAWSGYYSAEVLWLLLLLLPVMGLATLVGERLGNRVDAETFTRLLGVLLLASGLSLLAK